MQEEKKKNVAFKIKKKPGSQKGNKRPYQIRKKMSIGPKNKRDFDAAMMSDIQDHITHKSGKAHFEQFQNLHSTSALTSDYDIKIEKQHFDQNKMANFNYKLNFSNVWNFGPDIDIFSTQFSPDDSRISFGFNNGFVEIYSLINKKRSPQKCFTNCDLPVTHIRWINSSQIYASNAGGYLIQYDTIRGVQVHSIKEEDNQILAMDHNAIAKKVATSGKDCAVRIYDDETKKIVRQYCKGDFYSPGHNNRVFALKFKDDNPNIILTGGWDNSIFIWDIRNSKYVDAFTGCSVSGDTIDTKGNFLLIGSHRTKNPLELYDFGTRKKICSIDWAPNRKIENAYVYACKFSKNSEDEIVAGCSVRNEVQLFKRNITYKPTWTVNRFSQAIYSLDLSHNGEMVSVGGAGGICYLFRKGLYYDAEI